jgi:hypothetical protein
MVQTATNVQSKHFTSLNFDTWPLFYTSDYVVWEHYKLENFEKLELNFVCLNTYRVLNKRYQCFKTVFEDC